jgi:ferric-dicitrate binding protein FerR (iron transport regulator)
MTARSDDEDAESDASDRLLKQAFMPAPLPAERLEQIRTQTETEWKNAVAEHGRVRRWQRAGLSAAVLCACALTGWVIFWKPANTEIIGVFANAAPGSVVVIRPWRQNVLLATGSALRTGRIVETRATTRVALVGGGRLLLKAGTRIVTRSLHEIELRSGAAYVDIDSARAQGSLNIRTRYGLVMHLGTQFEVAVDGASQRVRVREGAVQLRGPVNVGARAGEQVTIDAGGVVKQSIPPSSPQWTWVDDVTDTYDVEGVSVASFVATVARLTGRRIEYADARVHQLANQTTLHGSVSGLPPLRAMRAILATASLSAIERDGIIRISMVAASPHQ